MPILKPHLEVNTGGMFASKSSALIAQGKRHLIAGHKVVFIKPDVDNRYSDEKIVTHDGQEVHSVVLPTDDYVCNAKEVQEADVVLIDEAQFFDFIHIGVTSLLEKGKVVYCSGLDMDYRGVPFYEMSQLMGIADKVNKLKAVCSDCGDDSYITAKTSGTDSRVEIGSKDIYKPLCRKCYNKLQEESK